MKEKQMVFKVLEVEDVERLVSEIVGREVKVGDMDIKLVDRVPMFSFQERIGSQMCCDVVVDGEYILDEGDEAPFNEYLPDIAYVPKEYIFDFDTSVFKSFERNTENFDGYYE